MREAPWLHHCQSNLFFSLRLHCPRRSPGALPPPPPAQWGSGYRPGYRLPAPPYGPCRGRSYFPVFSNTQAQRPGERCCRGTVSSQHYRRSHRYRRSRGLTGRRDEPWRAGSAAGSAGPSPAHPGAVRAPSISCLLYVFTAAGRERRDTVPQAAPPGGEGTRLVVGTQLRCLFECRGLGHKDSPWRGRRCSHSPGVRVDAGEEEEGSGRGG
ncbi:uncharacterized protein LOC117002976 [Catharus ustulatus]|uniref:uncharacterized protein LOC117002976 n=1 Tax=Catharus ustulatus TaxID=91951 RepID=UPI00140C6F3B|nr:uncharacterized protein LOC117002976 [Catharus ustulatus]